MRVSYLHKLLCVLMELLQYRQSLFRKAVFKNALDDSAAVRVSGEGKDLRDTKVITRFNLFNTYAKCDGAQWVE